MIELLCLFLMGNGDHLERPVVHFGAEVCTRDSMTFLEGLLGDQMICILQSHHRRNQRRLVR
jgi:hypothetical protein